MFKAVATNYKKTIEIKEAASLLDSFDIEFTRLTDKQRSDLLADIMLEAKSLDANLNDDADIADIKQAIGGSLELSLNRLKLNIAGWSNLLDSGDKPVIFSPENLDKLLEWREYRVPVERAFIEMLAKAGQEEAEKN